MTTLFPEIDPEERYPFTFDFGPAVETLADGTVLQSAQVTASMSPDSQIVDDTPGALIDGVTVVIGGLIAVVWIQGRMDGARYKLRCKGVLSDTSISVISGILPVVTA